MNRHSELVFLVETCFVRPACSCTHADRRWTIAATV